MQIVPQSQATPCILKLEHATGLVITDLCETATHVYKVKHTHGIMVGGAHVVQAVEEVHSIVLWNAEIKSE